jgi:predicted signal transduction protein with EAL and GGDEF domain
LLKEVGQRLNKAVKGMARIGRRRWRRVCGHLADLIDRPQLAELADKLISDISAPYLLGGVEVHIGATIGIAIAPEDGESEDEQTCGSDLALYRAKGLVGYLSILQAMDSGGCALQSGAESDLRRALADNQLSLAYQPFVSARSSERVGTKPFCGGIIPRAATFPRTASCRLSRMRA